MIDDIAVHLGTLDSVKSAEVQGNTVIASVNINSESFRLIIDFGGNFPAELPEVFLADPAGYGFLPHVCWQGKVCYNDGEGVSIDTSQSVEIAEYVLTKAISALSIEEDKKEEEFFNEFEGYWNRQDTCTAYSFLELTDKLQIIKSPVTKRHKIPVAFFPDNNDISLQHEYMFAGTCKENRTQMNAIYMPLEQYIEPPLPGEPVDIELLSNIVQALSDSNKEIWNTLLSKRKLPKDALHLLISHPRPKGGKSLYGLTIPYGFNWLNGKLKSYNHRIIPLSIKRHTPEHMIQRSGGSLIIANRNIAIIGCGSIGSRIAELLIMCGIRNLTLIDSDNFSSDNLFRHVLDSRYIGKKKTDSLSSQLKSRFPYISISTENTKVTTLTESLINHDVIVDVTGNPTLGRILNSSHRDLNREELPLLLTVWTEPLGLGGHATISNGKTKGCLHCLFHNDNTERLSSIFNFVKENQVVSRNLTGCGGAFTPFSALDATKTAEVATRMIIEALASKGITQHYKWWRGNSDAANEANIETTEWYSDCAGSVQSQIDEVFVKGCPVCQ